MIWRSVRSKRRHVSDMTPTRTSEWLLRAGARVQSPALLAEWLWQVLGPRARTWHGVVRRTTVLSVHPSIEHFVVCMKRNVYVIHFRIHATVACVKYTQDSVKDGRTVCFTSRILHSRVRRRDSSGPRVPGTVQPYRTARRQRGFGSRSGSTVRARARCRMAMVRMTVERAEARRGCERRR